MKTKYVHSTSSLPAKTAALLFWAALAFSAFGTTEEEINKQFTVKPGGKIVVDVAIGGITVNTNATSQVVVNVKRKVGRKTKADEEKYLKDYPVEFSQDGDTVTIQCRSEKNQGGFNIWNHRVNEAEYTITVPSHFNTKLHTAGGPIEVQDLTGDVKADTSGGGLHFARLHGPLNGDTSGGAIHVADCDGDLKIATSGGGIDVAGGGGSLDGSTSGGPVRVRNFRGPANVGTSGGGITLENIAGKIHGDTSGGGIHAVLLSPIPGPVKLSTSGGGITVQVPADAAFDLDAATSAGSVSSDLPVTVTGKIHHDNLRGPVNGGGTSVYLRTSGGSIRIVKGASVAKAEAEK